LREEVLKKRSFFKKPQISGLSAGLPPSRKAPARQDGVAGPSVSDALRGGLLRRLISSRIWVIARASVGVTHIDLIEHVIECLPIVHLDIKTA
jgi:hypothetical protein